MRQNLRFAIAAATLALGLAAAPLAAQNTAEPAPSPDEVVGPPQLRDFTLNGTVTRRAEPPPARSESPPARSSPTPPATASPPRQAPAASEAERRPQPQPRPSSGPAAPARSVTVDLPPAVPDAQPFTPAPAASPPAQSPARYQPAPFAADEGAPLGEGGPSVLPWLFAILLLGGGAAYYLRRQRSGYALAGGPALSELVQPDAPPRTLPPRPVPAPRAPDVPAGIVSTRLRPWLDIEFVPDRVIVEAERAVIQFGVVVFNSGSAPARDVLVEAAMFNAGPAQDQEIGAFFAHPVGKGDRVPHIAPLQRLELKSAVTLGREQMRQFEIGGRKLFVPLIGFNLLYRWSGGEAQTSASYLVGKDTKGEKMAPFRLDLGPRLFRGLAAREHSLRVRK